MPTTDDVPDALRDFDELPDSAYVREPVLCRLYGISPPTAWRWSKNGVLPVPEKIGPNITAWNVGKLRAKKRKAMEAACQAT